MVDRSGDPTQPCGSQAEKAVSWAEAVLEAGEARAQKLAAAIETLRQEMEQLSARVKDLILACPTADLLGYLWGQLLMASHPAGEEVDGPDKDVLNQFQFAL